MTGWLAWGVLMLVSFSKASVLSEELNDQINEGISKINETEKLVDKKVEEVNREINKNSLYFSRAVNESMIEGQRIYNYFFHKIEKSLMENFEEGIDLNTDIKILLYLLETLETTRNEFDGEYDILRSSLQKVLAQRSNELRKLENLFEFTYKFSKGLYDGLRASMKNCEDDECAKQLVHAAENKKKVLNNMFQKYVQEMSKISAALRYGHRQCIRDVQKNFSKVSKKFDVDMQYIPRTQGTDDSTDRSDSAILEW